MFTDEEINNGKDRFISLVRGIERDGARIDALIDKLERSDFFTAPASVMNHNATKGGLVLHSLSVFDTLKTIVSNSYKGTDCPYSDETLLIVSLFHDFSKMNYFELDYRNKKVYSTNGKKSDSNGTFDWVTVTSYKVRDANNRFCFGNPAETSVRMIETFIPLSTAEACAILNHQGASDRDANGQRDVSNVFTQCPLALFLHLADVYTTFYIDSHEPDN